MTVKKLKDKIKDKILKIKIELFYKKHKSKNMTKNYIEMLFNHNLTDVIKDINRCKTQEDFFEIIEKNLDRYLDYPQFISIFEGFNFEIFNGEVNFCYNKDLTKRYYENTMKSNDILKLIEEYKTIIHEYIINNKKIANEIYRGEDSFYNDFRIEIDEEMLVNIFKQIFKDRKKVSNRELGNIILIKRIIIQIQMLYSKEIIFNNKDFVKFEIENGCFDEYIYLLNHKNKIPTIEERFATFLENKNLTPDQQNKLKNLELLEKRINNLKSNDKKELEELLDKIKKETNKIKKIKLIEECYMLYEIIYREEIVDSLFAPTQSIELKDYDMLENILVHIFIRDPESILFSYKKKITEEIISKRFPQNKDEKLTEEEQEILDKKMKYAKEVLSNPVIVEESMIVDSYYTDASGWKGYISNTSNQISASLFSPENILGLSSCVGIGFDKNGLPSENIIISSPNYLTTNKGINNIEVDDNSIFRQLSTPLSELEKSVRSELVLHRKNIESETKSSYVFVVLAGEKQDQNILNQAKQIAEENNIKLIIFNLIELKKSYQEKYNKFEPKNTEKRAFKN